MFLERRIEQLVAEAAQNPTDRALDLVRRAAAQLGGVAWVERRLTEIMVEAAGSLKRGDNLRMIEGRLQAWHSVACRLVGIVPGRVGLRDKVSGGLGAA
jgi:hypothetical protein